jgi:hypothetical protein
MARMDRIAKLEKFLEKEWEKFNNGTDLGELQSAYEQGKAHIILESKKILEGE